MSVYDCVSFYVCVSMQIFIQNTLVFVCVWLGVNFETTVGAYVHFGKQVFYLLHFGINISKVRSVCQVPRADGKQLLFANASTETLSLKLL